MVKLDEKFMNRYINTRKLILTEMESIKRKRESQNKKMADLRHEMAVWDQHLLASEEKK